MSSASRDVGLGTAYERRAIYRALDRWLPDPPKTAVEGPVDGMAGLPGLHLLGLARRGTRVTVVHPDGDALERVRVVYARAGLGARLEVARERPDRRFDLALAFNLASTEDWRAALRASVAGAERAALFVTHPRSWGTWVRRGLRLLERGARGPELFEHPACDPDVLEPALRALGVIERRAFVDCPWWPDLFVSPGETLLGATAARLSGAGRRPARTPYDYGPADFPWATSPPRGLARALARHPGFDAWPAPVASIFAHHRAYLVRTVPMDL